MSLNVLFVEDEEDLRDMVGEAMRDWGYCVTVAANGHEALAHLRGSVPYSLIITDFSMPEGVSGLDVAVEAASVQPDARVLLVSGHQRSQLPGLPSGARFLPKPYRLKQLRSALEDAWT